MNTIVPNRPLYPVLIILTGVALAAAAFWFLWTLLLWYRLHPHLPWRDLFVILDDILPLLGTGTLWSEWQILIEPHYAAHRIAIPRLLVALDLSFFHGQNHVLYASAWLGMLGCIGLYMHMARDYFSKDKLAWYFCLGIIGVLFFAPAHLWNLINAINASWHITFACAFASFVILLRRPEKPGPVAWLLAYGFATVAAFTTFAGVIVWLLLPVLAFSSSRRTLLLTAGVSVLLTLGYLNGIASDAEVASVWDSKNLAVMNKIQATGKEALAANTPAVILHKAMKFLAWPMSATRPTTALVLVGLSFIVLGYYWFGVLFSRRLGRNEYHPWIKLGLLIATLSLGIAIATQLGRIIEQANHANGPSFERYNTVVAVYWSGIFSLLLGLQNYLPDRHRLALMAISLALVALLIAPGGNYLKQEVLSVEYAAILYASGETPGLRDKTDKKLIHFKPEYVYSFDAFFSENSLAYKKTVKTPGHKANQSECDTKTFEMTVSRSGKKGYREIEGHLSGALASLSRNILLFKGDKLAARLYPRHLGDYSPMALMNPAHNSWLGHIGNGASRADPLQLEVISLGPTSFRCRMGGTGRKSEAPAQQNAPEVPQNV